MAISQEEFEQWVALLQQMSPDQVEQAQKQIRSYLAHRFEAALADIHASVPTDISEEEIMADIDEAIREVRAEQKKKTGG